MTIKRMIAAASMFATFAVAPLPAEGQGSVASDRAALVALYDATDGDNWKDNTNWKTDRPLTEWHGVRTQQSDGRVWSIDLEVNNLTGEIPRELGSLTNLQYLYLQGNGLTGEIPRELGSLPYLSSLDLQGNNLTGEIPRELGSLTYLTTLQLGINNLTGEIPRELGSLTYLEVLQLDHNNLTGEIPRELGNLTNLRALYLYNNKLEGMIPEELRRFESEINPQQGGINLPVGIPTPALPAAAALLLAAGLWYIGRRRMAR